MNLPQSYHQPPESVPDTEIDSFETEAATLNQMAKMLDGQEVVDHESLEKAEQLLRSMSMVYKVVEDITERFRVPAYEYYKRVLEEKNDILAGPKLAIEGLRGRIKAYMLESNDDGVESVSLRHKWKAKLAEPAEESLAMLCSAIAAGEAPVGLVTLNQKFADKAAGVLNETMSYPGIVAYRDSSLVVKKGG